MASTSGGGVLADVQRQLAAGWSDEDILAALTAKGLSRVSAERFLQRARPAGSAPPPVPVPVAPPPVPLAPPPLPAEAPTVVFTAPPPPAEAATVLFEAPALPADTPTVVFEAPPVPSDGPPPIPANAPPPVPAAVASPRRVEPPPPPSSNTSDGPSAASWLGVIGGSLVMTLGLIFLAWALGQERVRIRLPLALTFGGAAWLFSSARGLVDLRRPATWVLPGTAAAPPALAALAVIGALLTTGTPRQPREVTDGVAAAEARAPLARRPRATREGTIAAEVERLQGTRAGDPCQAANMLAELGAQEQVPLLQHFFDDAATDDRKVCAAHALTRLGEGPAMLPHYLEWSRSDSDTLVHHAIVGFGHIGPSAAHEAVPVLQDILTDNASAARRWVVVSTLAKLGPTAAPALQLVVDDEDAQVRTAAQKALEKLR